jgi:transposase
MAGGVSFFYPKLYLDPNKYYRAFIYPYTNGYLEGINNKIEVIKRMAYGIRNFHQLRNKVLCSLI